MQGPSKRSTVKRNARRAVYERDQLMDILHAQQICHVAYVEQGEPRIIATLYFCDEEYLYLHGNRQAAYLRHLLDGGEATVSVMLIDGVVVARSGFHCSMNYRSVTVFGKGEMVPDGEHETILNKFVERLVPGHQQAVRAATSQELAATAVARIPLTEMSAKVRGGDPIDDESDLTSNVWAGQIPVRTETLSPINSEDLDAGIDVPDYIKNFQFRG